MRYLAKSRSKRAEDRARLDEMEQYLDKVLNSGLTVVSQEDLADIPQDLQPTEVLPLNIEGLENDI